MEDYINRKALNEKCYAIYEETMREGKDLTAQEVDKLMCRFETAIKEAPAADVAPVIFCRQCAAHNRCAAEQNFLSEGIAEPFCCRGARTDGDRR